ENRTHQPFSSAKELPSRLGLCVVRRWSLLREMTTQVLGKSLDHFIERHRQCVRFLRWIVPVGTRDHARTPKSDEDWGYLSELKRSDIPQRDVVVRFFHFSPVYSFRFTCRSIIRRMLIRINIPVPSSL